MWNNVKSLSQKNKQTPPRCIVFDNQKVTSLKNIANISNQFFIDKILKLRGQFTPPNFSALDILSKIFPRNQNTWKLQLMTIEQTMEIIKKAKGTNSLGPDNISMKTIKKLGPCIAPHITHLINSIIIKQIYPEILQISRITPN